MAISKNQKILAVQNLTEKFKQAQALVLTDYTGLKVNQINKLRDEIKEAGGEFEVVKNSLLHLAAKDYHSQDKFKDLENPTAVLWLYKKNPTPLKALDTFIKENDQPQIKFGFWQQDFLNPEKVIELAHLPGLKELRGQFVGQLKAPLSRLNYVLKDNLQKLVFILKEVSKNGRQEN